MSTKSQPLSLRLSPSSYEFVKDEAERTGRSRSAIVESLAEEGLRMRLFPGIAFREGSPRRAWVMGTGLDVWEIVQALEDSGSMEQLLAETDHDERLIRLAVAYRDRYSDEIAAMVARNRRSLDEWRGLYPTFGVTEI